MELANFEALSFDCYGTLIDWETGISAVLGRWARSRGLEVDAETLLATFAAEEADAEAARPGALYRVILAEVMRGLGRSLGAEVSDEDAAALARSVGDWPPFPDSHDALVALGKRYELIVLSNVDRASFARSGQRLGVQFSSVITAQDVGCYKPSARNFEVLLEEAAHLGVREGGLLHVAQSLFHDHVPAKAAGLPTVWINRRRDAGGWGATPPPQACVEPDWEFPTMAAFAEAARVR